MQERYTKLNDLNDKIDGQPANFREGLGGRLLLKNKTMSGGSHDYAYLKLNEVADSFYYERGHEEARKKVAEILRLMSDICHDIEWIDSGDYGDEDWKDIEEKLARINLLGNNK